MRLRGAAFHDASCLTAQHEGSALGLCCGLGFFPAAGPCCLTLSASFPLSVAYMSVDGALHCGAEQDANDTHPATAAAACRDNPSLWHSLHLLVFLLLVVAVATAAAVDLALALAVAVAAVMWSSSSWAWSWLLWSWSWLLLLLVVLWWCCCCDGGGGAVVRWCWFW